jgi:hypothetical protein
MFPIGKFNVETTSFCSIAADARIIEMPANRAKLMEYGTGQQIGFEPALAAVLFNPFQHLNGCDHGAGWVLCEKCSPNFSKLGHFKQCLLPSGDGVVVHVAISPSR